MPFIICPFHSVYNVSDDMVMTYITEHGWGGDMYIVRGNDIKIGFHFTLPIILYCSNFKYLSTINISFHWVPVTGPSHKKYSWLTEQSTVSRQSLVDFINIPSPTLHLSNTFVKIVSQSSHDKIATYTTRHTDNKFTYTTTRK